MGKHTLKQFGVSMKVVNELKINFQVYSCEDSKIGNFRKTFPNL